MNQYSIHKHQIIRVKCTSLVPNGYGLSYPISENTKLYLNIHTGFILGLLKGETSLVRVVRKKSKYFEAVPITKEELSLYIHEWEEFYQTVIQDHLKESIPYHLFGKKKYNNIAYKLQYILTDIISIENIGKSLSFLKQELALVKDKLSKFIETNTSSINIPWVLENPSSERRESPCPNFISCGGCKLLHLDYITTCQYKKEWFLNHLQRNNIQYTKQIKIITSPKEFHYRNHVQVHINKSKEQGFYAPGSYRVVPFPESGCLIFDQKLSDSYFPENIKKSRCVRIRLSDNQALHTELHSEADKTSTFTYSITYPKNEKTSIQILNTAFFQINTSFLPIWLKLIEGFLKETSTEITYPLSPNTSTQNFPPLKVLELFSGFGFISQIIQQNIPITTIGIDIIPKKALEYVQFYNANRSIPYEKFKDNYISHDLNNLTNLTQEYQDKIQQFSPEVLLLNPPRNGFIKESLMFLFDTIINKHFHSIIYSSCDAATFSRDLAELIKYNYTIKKLYILDFFPYTSHFEVLAYLRKIT